MCKMHHHHEEEQQAVVLWISISALLLRSVHALGRPPQIWQNVSVLPVLMCYHLRIDLDR